MQNKFYDKFMKSSKKSQVEDWLPMVLFLVFILFLLLFLLLPTSTNKAKKSEIFEFQSLEIDSQKLLADYLKMPFDLNGIEINMANSISSYFLNQDESILQRIKQETHSFFSKTELETASSSWSLEINSENKGAIIIELKKSESSRKQQSLGSKVSNFEKKEISKITIPAQNFEIIEIRLFYLKFN